MPNANRAQLYKIMIERDERTQDFVAIAPELGNCAVRAQSQKDVIELMNQEIEKQLMALEQQNQPIPMPFAQKHFSGKIMLRVDPTLHRDLAQRAAREGTSMAQFIERKLNSK